MSQTHDLELISFDICPYVERSRIVLEEKDVDYDIEFISLDDKPDWFLEISPRGKVPVLLVDEEPVFESNVINEMLEELYPEPRMFPEDPVERAQARAWIVFNNDELMGPAARLWFSDDEAAIREARDELREALEKVDDELADRDATYFMGEDFGLVDAIYAPLFTRWEAVERMGHSDLLDGLETLAEYAEKLTERQSVKDAQDPELIPKMMDY